MMPLRLRDGFRQRLQLPLGKQPADTETRILQMLPDTFEFIVFHYQLPEAPPPPKLPPPPLNPPPKPPLLLPPL